MFPYLHSSPVFIACRPSTSSISKTCLLGFALRPVATQNTHTTINQPCTCMCTHEKKGKKTQIKQDAY